MRHQQDSLGAGCVVRADACAATATARAESEPAWRPTRRSASACAATPPWHADPNAVRAGEEYRPLFHKKMVPQAQHRPRQSRRRVFSESSQIQLGDHRAVSAALSSNNSITGSCRRQRAASAVSSRAGGDALHATPLAQQQQQQRQQLYTPFATSSDSPIPAAALAAQETPRPGVRRVQQPWARDSGRILAQPGEGGDGGGSALASPAAAAEALRRSSRRAASVEGRPGAGRSTDFTQPTSEVYDVSMGLTTRRHLRPPCDAASLSGVPFFARAPRAEQYRPQLRQRDAIHPAGLIDPPARPKLSKRFCATSRSSAAQIAAASAPSPAIGSSGGIFGMSASAGAAASGAAAAVGNGGPVRGKRRVGGTSGNFGVGGSPAGGAKAEVAPAPGAAASCRRAGRRHVAPTEHAPPHSGKRQFLRTATAPLTPA